jgi:hypothetical protein
VLERVKIASGDLFVGVVSFTSSKVVVVERGRDTEVRVFSIVFFEGACREGGKGGKSAANHKQAECLAIWMVSYLDG